MYPDLSPDKAGQNEMMLLYMNCPPEMTENSLRVRAFSSSNASFSQHIFIVA